MPISSSTRITPADARENTKRPSGTPDGRPIAACAQRTSRPRRARSAPGNCLERAPRLREVEPVVSREHAEQEVEALTASLGVDADAGAIPLPGKAAQRLAWAAAAVLQSQEDR